MSLSPRLPTLLALTLALGAAPGAGAQQVERHTPEATDSTIARGRKVYNGPANCSACHGAEGHGTKAAPDLTDATWARGRGTYLDILDRVTHGVPRRESPTGQAMPMRGWTPLGDDDVRAVAAYVWSLSHPPKASLRIGTFIPIRWTLQPRAGRLCIV